MRVESLAVEAILSIIVHEVSVYLWKPIEIDRPHFLRSAAGRVNNYLAFMPFASG